MHFAAGLSGMGADLMVHVRPPEIDPPENAAGTCLIGVYRAPSERAAFIGWWETAQFTSPTALLLVGAIGHRVSGQAEGRIKPVPHALRDEIIGELDLKGEEMRRVSLTGNPASDFSSRRTERWSRTQSAIGEDVLGRIQSTRVAIVGCGRLGSRLAEDLVFGFGLKDIILLDGDRLEHSNKGEVSILLVNGDVGEHKVDVLARSLQQEAPWARPEPRPIMLTPGESEAIDAIRTADLLFCATDTLPSRLVAGWVATSMGIPHFDLGVGALRERGRRDDLVIGADCRLVFGTDEPRCVLCFGGGLGGATTLQEALQVMRREDRGMVADEVERLGRFERRGSLRHLCGWCSSMAMQLMVELFRGEIERPVHLRVRGFEMIREGAPPIADRAPQDCLCQFSACGSQRAEAVLGTGKLLLN
jgi:hypothetical protein